MLDRSTVDEIRGIVAATDLERKLAATEKLVAARDRFVRDADPRDDPGAGTLGDARRRGGIAEPAGAADRLDIAERSDAAERPGAAERPDVEVRDDASFAPGRPAGWRVLPSHEISDRRDLADPAGRFQFLHAVANIELCAVELALLHAADFPRMEAGFHHDWLRVAGEEVAHFRMVARRLGDLGGAFGDEPVHLGLLASAGACRGLVERMSVVPRILEARGLDVSAPLRARLAAARDDDSREVLAVIYRDEIGHVAAGTRWLARACALEGTDPESRFVSVLEAFRSRRRLRPGPVDLEGRRAAGFTERELEAIRGGPAR